jgi:6-phosphogluconolactonase
MKNIISFIKKSSLSFFILILISMSSHSQIFHLFIGTYTSTGSKGIYVYSFDSHNGKSHWISNTDSVINPSFLILSKDGNHLFAVNETNGDNPGRVSSFSVDQQKGTLTFLNSQPSGGDDPCFLATDKIENWLTVANYSSGSASALKINKDGTIEPFSQLIETSGSSVNKARQEKSHIHETVFSPDYKFLFTPDLGTDKIMIYHFDPTLEKPLKKAADPFLKIPAGNGPRHMAFHPNNQFAYVINELSGSLMAYKYDNGKFQELQTISTHPADFKGDIGAAEIQISADGKFLYASNRGDQNSIAIFSIDEDGKLKLQGYQSTLGKGPRHFIIDPTGGFLLVANQDSNNIVVFKRDKQTGLLTDLHQQIAVLKPVCLQMIEVK